MECTMTTERFTSVVVASVASRLPTTSKRQQLSNQADRILSDNGFDHLGLPKGRGRIKGAGRFVLPTVGVLTMGVIPTTGIAWIL
jgi:hypothetical protein